MKLTARIARLIAILGSVAVWPAMAQAPRVINAKFETRSVAGGLARGFEAIVQNEGTPAWIGYAVPMVAGQNQMCCSNSYLGYRDGGACGPCRLEHTDSDVNITNADKQGPVHLEGQRRLIVLFRAEQKRVERIRAFSEDCELDAGGLPFLWLGDVTAAESVALLLPYASDSAGGNEGRDSSHQALGAIAMTADASADRALESMVAPNQPEDVRGRAVFWLGAARGASGYRQLEKLSREDPSDKVRGKVVFALSVNPEPEAVNTMIRMAKTDASSHVRGQALFWLGQKAGKNAEAAITDAIANDPETEVKTRAVFALSQLPKDEGVPMLIQVAKTNRNLAVRKQAMFWLGQSHDPRALAFFEEVLAR